MKDTLPPELGYLHLLTIEVPLAVITSPSSSLGRVVTGTGTMAVVCVCAAW